MAFDAVQYKNDYTRQNYDIVRATVPKGKGQVIKAYAQAQGKSVSQIIIDALEECYKLDLSKADGG